MTIRIALAAALLSLASGALAAEPKAGEQGSGPERGSSAAPPSPATGHVGAPARRAARTLVTERHWSELLDGYAESLSRRMEAALQSQGTAAPNDLRTHVRRDLGAALPYARMLDVHAAELERHFSTNELDDISRFYEGPTGQKLLRELPAVGDAVNNSFRELLAAVVPGIVQRNAPSLGGAATGTGEGPDHAE